MSAMFLRVHLSHTGICWDMSPFGNSRSYIDLTIYYSEPTSIPEVEKGALCYHYNVYCLSVYLPVTVRFNFDIR